MKSRKKLIIVISILLLMIVGKVSENSNVKYIVASMIYGHQISSDIIFSKKSGFYNKEFELHLYAPTEEIYYTLDGTDPDKNSIKYEAPIFIKDASENSNIYASRTDVTTRFSEEAERYSEGLEDDPLYKVPADNIDKCNIVKVVYYDKDGKRSVIEERVYFIDFNEKQGYDDVNIISITTDPENLFDAATGIYTTGDIFKEFSESTLSDEYRKKDYWHHWDANYYQKGIEWEKESNIQVFDINKRLVLSQNAGIRIQGGRSRGFLPKSLNIYAREEYGDNKLYYDFFRTGYYPKRVTLTSGGDDYYTKIKDRLVSELASDCDVVTMNYEPYVLFLNGEYWGFYYLTEKYDVQFIEHYYGVDRGTLIDDIIMIKNGSVETGVSAD